MEKVPTSNPSREASVHNYYKHTQNLNHNVFKINDHTQNERPPMGREELQS